VTDGAKMESPLTVIVWANGIEVRPSTDPTFEISESVKIEKYILTGC